MHTMDKTYYCVIMAGGIGSRFWPVSRSNMPKQFIDILGVGRTLIQQTFDRFTKIIPDENIYVVTNEEYINIVREQLPKVPVENILGEPMRRNTAPCIMYANCKIGLKNPDAKIVVTPADHLILNEDLFLDNITEGLEFVTESNALLTLGITPNRPATGYGYIQMSENAENQKFIPVKTFTEKPQLELAKFFLESGDFLWNSGIFLWKQTSIRDAIKNHLKELYSLFSEGIKNFNTPREKETITEIYSGAKSISIDFGVMEKEPNVYVMQTNFGWSDLGTWNSLYTIAERDENGNSDLYKNTLFANSNGNYVNVQGDKKVAIIRDLDDFIVVDTDKALLICKRENEQTLTEMLNDAKVKFGDGIK